MIINAVTGGGGDDLRLTILTGTTEPSSAKNGVVWVKTTEKITSWYISPDQPSALDPGRLLLVAADKGSNVSFGRKNKAALHLAFASLCRGGDWRPVDASFYSGGSWLPLSTVSLYKNGIGAAANKKVVNGTVTAGTNAITVKTTGGGKAGEAYAVFGPLTLSGVTTVSMRAKSTDKTTNVYFALMASQTDATRTTAELKTETEITDKEEHIITLDVSDKSGNGWYIYAGINTAGMGWSVARTADVTEVHLDELV